MKKSSKTHKPGRNGKLSAKAGSFARRMKDGIMHPHKPRGVEYLAYCYRVRLERLRHLAHEVYREVSFTTRFEENEMRAIFRGLPTIGQLCYVKPSELRERLNG